METLRDVGRWNSDSQGELMLYCYVPGVRKVEKSCFWSARGQGQGNCEGKAVSAGRRSRGHAASFLPKTRLGMPLEAQDWHFGAL